jgi:hypothetical protein
MDTDRISKRKLLIEEKLNSIQILNKNLNLNIGNMSKDDCEKIRNFYYLKLDELNKLKEQNDNKTLIDVVESKIRRNQVLEGENFTSEAKFRKMDAEFKKISTTMDELNTNLNNKEKFGKMIVEKINKINTDKQKIITDESEKRNDLVKETENFVRALQTKYEEELPEKKRLLEENAELRINIENCIRNSGSLKEVLENKLKEKEKFSETMENKLRVELKSKMEKLTYDAQKYIFENSELKQQIENHKNKKQEILDLVKAFNQEYDKLIKEVEKVFFNNNFFEKFIFIIYFIN